MKLSNSSCVQSLLLGLILNLSSLTASAQGFMWAQGFTSNPSGIAVSACATDDDNNGYFIGTFHGTTDFDPGPGVMNMTPVGYYDLFILKKDADGNLLWMKQIKGTAADTGMCYGKGIGVDNLGNIYIGGSFRDTFDFDPGPGVHLLGAYANGNYYSSNGFILKLSPSGDFIWVKNIGSQTTVFGFGIQDLKLDAAANIYFGGQMSGTTSPVTIDVDPGPGVYDIISPGLGSSDILIEKLDSAGNFIWAKQISGTDHKGVWALALDTLSNLHITGQFRGTADFDPGPGIANLTSVGDYDAFVAKYDYDGNYLWAGKLGGTGADQGNDIATDTFGNVLVTGRIGSGIIGYDPGSGTYNYTNIYPSGGYILKLRSNGSLDWIESFSKGGTAVATDGLGNVLISAPSFLRKMDSTGNVVWSKSFDVDNWPHEISATAIAVDQANDIYLVGTCSGAIDLNPGPGVFSGYNAFILKLCGESLDLAITANNDVICPQGDFVEITTPAISGATYTWTCNGAVVPGNNSNTITTSQPGIYEVFIDGSCPSASGEVYIYDCFGNLYDAAGVSGAMKAAGIDVYPNPFDDVLTVKGLQGNDQVSLIDITGRVIHSWQGAMATETFMINDIAPGYYVLKVMNEHGVVRVNVPVVKK